MTEGKKRRVVTDDIECQSARPMPKQVDIRVWIVMIVIIGLLAWIMLIG